MIQRYSKERRYENFEIHIIEKKPFLSFEERERERENYKINASIRTSIRSQFYISS